MRPRDTARLALACYLVPLLLSGTGPMHALEAASYALRMRWTSRPAPDPRLVIAAKDDETWASLPEGRWGRHILAGTLDAARQARVSAVGVDFVLDTRKDDDPRLVEALRAGPPAVLASQEVRGRAAAQGAAVLTSTVGAHSGLRPLAAEGFINLNRDRTLKAPALSVELYRLDPQGQPRAGFAFALFLRHLVAQALGAGPPGASPAPPAPPASDDLEAWARWLEDQAPATRPQPAFPDPHMQQLLDEAAVRSLLARAGQPAPDERVRALAAQVGRSLIAIRLPGPPPTQRVHRIDYAGRAGTFRRIPLYRLAAAGERAAFLGGPVVSLAPGDHLRLPPSPASEAAASPPPARAVPARAVPAGRIRLDLGGDLSGAVLAAHLPTGAVVSGTVEADGTFTAPALPPGPAAVWLVARRGGRLVSKEHRSVDLPADLDLTLPAPSGRVRLAGPPGAQVELTSSSLAPELPSMHVAGTLGKDGTLDLDRLWPGEYAAVVRQAGATPGGPGFLVVPAGGALAQAAPPTRPEPGAAEVTPPPGHEWVAYALPGLQARPLEGTTRLPAGEYLLAERTPQGLRAHRPELAALEGTLMLVGTTMEADQDSYPTPLDLGDGGDMPGVEVHAHALSNLLAGRQLVPAGPWADAAVSLGALLLVGSAFHLAAPIPATLLGLAALALYWAFAAWLLGGPGVRLVTAPGLVGGLGFLGAQLAVALRGAQREARYIREVFGKCVDPVLRDRLLTAPDLVLSGEERELTVLFSDVRGFTTLSETLTPEELLDTLNSYFSRVTPVFLAHGGVFDKFIGDAFMGFFGAPLDQPDHAQKAVEAAIAMLEEGARWRAEREAAGLPHFKVGFGINTGVAIAGAIGGETSRVNYSVLGDAVNVAARLESLCKEHHATLLTSGDTLARCQTDFGAEDLGEVQVKGRKEAVRVMRVRRQDPDEG